jgi:hypothetical protein
MAKPDHFSTDPAKWSLSELLLEKRHGMPAAIGEYRRRMKDCHDEA